MLSQVVVQVIEEVIDEAVNSNEWFTALTISKEVKNRGVTERHRNMRGEIHQYISELIEEGDADYDKTLIRINASGGANAFLYHSRGADISGWDGDTALVLAKVASPRARVALPAPTVAPITVVKNPVVVKAVPSKDPYLNDGDVKTLKGALIKADPKFANKFASNLVFPDSRGRICVPVKKLKEVGIASGDIVLVYIDDLAKTLTIVKSGVPFPAAANREVRRLLVDRSGNVRISSQIVNKANLKTDRALFSTTKNSVVIG